MSGANGWREAIEWIGFGFEGLDVAVIAAGSIVAVFRVGLMPRERLQIPYRRLRQELGGAIVLGLEFLVAGDIIRTVAVDPTLRNVEVLGLIVLIRTFLSVTLQLEIDGCWPWQRGAVYGVGQTSDAAWVRVNRRRPTDDRAER